MSWWQFIFLVFVGIPLLMLWVAVLVDVLRRTDLTGVKIAMWVVLLLVFPFIGAIAYFIVRPEAPVLRGSRSLTGDEAERYAATQHALTYDTPGGPGPHTTIPPRAR